jgi:hypothetical protein
MQGLQNNPGLLGSVMDMVRSDPALRNQALERMRQSGGLVGVSGAAISEEALNSALSSLASDPQRLQSILNFIGQNPQLMQGMLGQMGLPNVSAEEINAAFGQLGQDPALLGRLARGDQAAIDQLADKIAGEQGATQGGGSGLSGMRPEELAALYQRMQQGGGTPPDGLPANGIPGLGGMAGGMGMGAPGGLGGPAPGGATPPGWAMPQGGSSSQMLGTDLLGTGASLSVLADMLGVFGGGPQMSHLQSSLRQGDLQALFAMVHEIYGPNGTLARDPSLGLPHGADSYTDLLNQLMANGDE